MVKCYSSSSKNLS